MAEVQLQRVKTMKLALYFLGIQKYAMATVGMHIYMIIALFDQNWFEIDFQLLKNN